VPVHDPAAALNAWRTELGVRRTHATLLLELLERVRVEAAKVP